MDPPAAPSSLHPMVNDLNLKAQGPDNKTFHPNGLDKEDSINNVEVIHGKSFYIGLINRKRGGELNNKSI